MDCQAIGRKVRIIHHQETQYHAEQPGKSEREEASIDYSGGKRVLCANGGTVIMTAGTTSGQMPMALLWKSKFCERMCQVASTTHDGHDSWLEV